VGKQVRAPMQAAWSEQNEMMVLIFWKFSLEWLRAARDAESGHMASLHALAASPLVIEREEVALALLAMIESRPRAAFLVGGRARVPHSQAFRASIPCASNLWGWRQRSVLFPPQLPGHLVETANALLERMALPQALAMARRALTVAGGELYLDAACVAVDALHRLRRDGEAARITREALEYAGRRQLTGGGRVAMDLACCRRPRQSRTSWASCWVTRPKLSWRTTGLLRLSSRCGRPSSLRRSWVARPSRTGKLPATSQAWSLRKGITLPPCPGSDISWPWRTSWRGGWRRRWPSTVS
jgi:hypothetical protein